MHKTGEGEVNAGKIYTLQPKQREDGTFPDPYRVLPDGQGSILNCPVRLLGFSKTGKCGVDLTITEFGELPHKAFGMYPVFTDQRGDRFIGGEPIDTISERPQKRIKVD